MTESIVKDIVNEVLNGFSQNILIPCPICKATIDCVGQDIESDSNFYFCANCGFSIKKQNIE